MAIDEGMLTRCGLGYRAAVIQAGEGLPAYDFAVFDPGTTGRAGRQRITTRAPEIWCSEDVRTQHHRLR